jgi:hypothetical protein
VASRLSGFEAITPAMERTKRQLFTPFRFRHWARLAVVVMCTGDFAGGGGGSWGGWNFPPPNSGSNGKQLLPPFSMPDNLGTAFTNYWQWIALGIILIVLLALAFVYVACVFRFVLFDSVLNNRCELGEGWRKWQPQGASYFLWTIGFGILSSMVMLVLIGGPILLVWRAGVFSNPGDHIFFLITGGLVLLFLGLVLIFAVALTSLFVKDFVIPVMALEDRGVLDGWSRVWPILTAEKGAFTLYVLLKIGLGLGSAILFGIINVIVLLLLFVPVAIVSAVVIAVGAAMGLTWGTFTICLAVIVGGVFLMLIIYILSFISAPALVFFQSYSLHFLGPRYPRLDLELARTAPPPKTTPPVPDAINPLPASS